MSLGLDDLPRDYEGLLLHLQRTMEVVAAQCSRITALELERDTVLAEREAVCAERDTARAEIEKLRLLIRQLQRGRFGRRSEKLDPDQLQLGLEDLEQTVAAAEAAQEVVAARSRAPLGRPGFGDATWAPCRRTCRGSRCWSTSRTRAAPAAARACM
jgi:Transposase C of IS166 homeodomain